MPNHRFRDIPVGGLASWLLHWGRSMKEKQGLAQKPEVASRPWPCSPGDGPEHPEPLSRIADHLRS
jgi:hypothetical protein